MKTVLPGVVRYDAGCRVEDHRLDAPRTPETLESAVNSSPFDEMAADYDVVFTNATLGRELRRIVWERMSPLFEAGQQVLEIGCGTGEDALWLARRGVAVTATDASARMVDVARARVNRADGGRTAEFHCVAMENLAGRFGGRMFDGVFSNFGAINCAHDIPATVGDVAGLIRPGGQLVWVVMGRHVPWEWVWYLARGDWRRASRRYQAGGTIWRGLRIVYPTPRELTAALAPYFAVSGVLPLGWALPPSYAAGWSDRMPRLFAALAGLERRAVRAALLAAALASVSDHFIVEATRRPVPGTPSAACGAHGDRSS